MNTPIVATLDEIRHYKPCANSWRAMLRHKGKIRPDKEIFPVSDVLDACGQNEALWCIDMIGYKPLVRHYVADCCERIAHLLTDPRSLNAIQAARRYASGQSDRTELSRAWNDAWVAVAVAENDRQADAAQAVAWNLAEISPFGVALGATLNAAGRSELAWQTVRLRHLLTAGQWSPAN